MENLTSIQELDAVLNILATNAKTFGHVSDSELKKIIEAENINVGNDLIQILNKLERDINVDIHLNDAGIKRYTISFEGKLFNMAGGYCKQREMENLTATQISADLALRKMNDRRLVLATFFAGIAGFALIFWGDTKDFLDRKTLLVLGETAEIPVSLPPLSNFPSSFALLPLRLNRLENKI